jgi:hypothetical protein
MLHIAIKKRKTMTFFIDFEGMSKKEKDKYLEKIESILSCEKNINHKEKYHKLSKVKVNDITQKGEGNGINNNRKKGKS